MTEYFKGWTRKKLLALPHRNWKLTSSYSSLLLYPSQIKHDSGWGCMTLIGCEDIKPVEVITEYADDFKIHGDHSIDCVYAIRAFHLWRNNHRFTVSHALSSTTISVEAVDES